MTEHRIVRIARGKYPIGQGSTGCARKMWNGNLST